MPSTLNRAVLGLLLAATLAGALTLDRRTWPEIVGDEATYLMQAQSLAWDFDLRYSRQDYERFVAQWGRKPEGLILQSPDGGTTLFYGKPSAYPLFIAPFVRLSPTRGAAIANALFLALAAAIATRSLERRIGPAAALWVAVWIFGSVAFIYVFWAHSDLFQMCLAAIALALAYGHSAEDTGRRFALRWLAVGALLGLVFMARPFYGTLLLPAALAVPAGRRRTGIAALAAGAVSLVLVAALANVAARGTWTSYAGDRQSFYSYTGYPKVELPAESWGQRTAEHGTASWVEGASAQVDVASRQTMWNVLYFLVGRHVGVLPYFLPLVLGFFAWRRGEGRWALVLAVVVTAACFLVIRPFNFWGGGGAIANRYFLPVYPALWFVAARPARAVWALVVAALAAPFLWPLWTAPRGFPIDAEGGYRHVSAVAQRWLPYETTLSHLKPAGQEDIIHNGLWVKLLTPALRAEADGGRLRLASGRPGDLLIGSREPLQTLRLRLPPGGPRQLTLSGAEVTETLQRRDGGVTLRLLFPGPRARHRMWWAEEDVWLYELRLAPQADDVAFQLLPEPATP
ncbi:MAG TPA: hypothetical protein VMW27_05985 [Thermoanaerobaculia bacterium]|nr:hypothetical protein [Thermoanaerobaculia bacterium]